MMGLFIYNGQTLLFGQSNLKEGNNNFALFTKTGEFKNLESARKYSDEAFKTSKDSTTYRNNLLRSLVYSSLAVADSNRTLKYTKDPIDVARYSLNQLTDKDLNYENDGQLVYIRRKLALAYQFNAKRALSNNEYQGAFDNFQKVDSFSNGQLSVKKNLAFLSEKLDKKELAISYYKAYLKNRAQSRPEDFLILSKLYVETGNQNESVNALLSALDIYPKNKAVLFKLINTYANNRAYDAIVPIIGNAIALDPENIDLLYLAGYANEVTGNRKMAEVYYQNVINLDENNYEGNLELGLLYLKTYLKNPTSENEELAEKYLLKANEIDPTALNALKALAILFKKAEDTFQYERVQNQINQ